MRKRILSALGPCLLSLLLTGGSFAGTYEIDWYSIDGGGASVASTGALSVAATIGQCDATSGGQLRAGTLALTGGFWSLPVNDILVAPDFTGDGHVDLADIAALNTCVAGPEIPIEAACVAKDLDGDGDVDQIDFGILQGCFSGPHQAPPAHCAD